MERDELNSWLRLSLTEGVGNVTARKLLAALGSPKAVFEQSRQALTQLVSSNQANALQNVPAELGTLLTTTMRWLALSLKDGVGRRVVTLGDPLYPDSLLNIEDPPLLLYLMGRVDTPYPSSNCLAIVGSRNPTPQGAINASQFAHTFETGGFTVVSGLALGVDAAAHEGALLRTPEAQTHLATIAVVGTGLDRVYPSQHRDLAHRIATRGLLISEYPLGTPPLAENFPKRNRLISGLSCATLVVEAALKSGSLITAKLAAEQGKDVFAIPGSIHSTQSRGCHALIRQGAKLVESAQDVLEELIPFTSQRELVSDDTQTTPDMDEDTDDKLLNALGFDPVSLEALQARTGKDTAHLQASLMSLELEGRVVRLPGGLFQSIHQG
jgi:DNA processing protein